MSEFTTTSTVPKSPGSGETGPPPLVAPTTATVLATVPTGKRYIWEEQPCKDD